MKDTPGEMLILKAKPGQVNNGKVNIGFGVARDGGARKDQERLN